MTNKEAIEELKKVDTLDMPARLCEAHYMSIKALEQEPKTGHWINSNIPNEEYVCSECGGACWYYDYQAKVAKSKFCPNCGARMVEPQESESNV